eukprot:6214818-Pleurochrysis_carterae.AAC.5
MFSLTQSNVQSHASAGLKSSISQTLSRERSCVRARGAFSQRALLSRQRSRAVNACLIGTLNSNEARARFQRGFCIVRSGARGANELGVCSLCAARRWRTRRVVQKRRSRHETGRPEWLAAGGCAPAFGSDAACERPCYVLMSQHSVSSVACECGSSFVAICLAASAFHFCQREKETPNVATSSCFWTFLLTRQDIIHRLVRTNERDGMNKYSRTFSWARSYLLERNSQDTQGK